MPDFKLFGTKENSVISANPCVLLTRHFTYYPVHIIKPLDVKKTFFLEAYFLQTYLKLT